jgi:hypothetical protein
MNAQQGLAVFICGMWTAIIAWQFTGSVQRWTWADFGTMLFVWLAPLLTLYFVMRAGAWMARGLTDKNRMRSL